MRIQAFNIPSSEAGMMDMSLLPLLDDFDRSQRAALGDGVNCEAHLKERSFEGGNSCLGAADLGNPVEETVQLNPRRRFSGRPRIQVFEGLFLVQRHDRQSVSVVLFLVLNVQDDGEPACRDPVRPAVNAPVPSKATVISSATVPASPFSRAQAVAMSATTSPVATIRQAVSLTLPKFESHRIFFLLAKLFHDKGWLYSLRLSERSPTLDLPQLLSLTSQPVLLSSRTAGHLQLISLFASGLEQPKDAQ